jgi:general stress protein CsbA
MGYRSISRVFTNNYGYWAVTLVIVNNYGYRTDIYSYWLITIDIELIEQTACHNHTAKCDRLICIQTFKQL